MNELLELRRKLEKEADAKRAGVLQRFFKTGKEEYGEGDIFLGITVPVSRKMAIKFKNLAFSQISKLLKSKIHEERLIALLILVYRFNNGQPEEKKFIFNFYLKNTKYINNWDLVDLSADKIVGGYLFNSLDLTHSLNKGRGPVKSTPFLLTELAYSINIWERRIAMIATYYFIKNGKFDATLKVAEILLLDKHDLIHKAVGWMLREVGKKDLQTEIGFLNKHYRRMPRTMLRYAIERFPGKLKKAYLKRKD